MTSYYNVGNRVGNGRNVANVGHSMWMGAVSGMIGISVMYPVDVVKTRIQETCGKTNAMEICKRVYVKEGFGAMYKGLIPQLMGTGPDKAISLATRNWFMSAFEDSYSYTAIMASAGGAGAVQSVIMSPVEIIKVRMQLDSAQTARRIIAELGMKGLYRGYSACFLRDVTFSTTYFTLYEMSKQMFDIHPDSSSLLVRLAAGTAAGIPAAFLTTPLDVFKTRLQAGDGRLSVLEVSRTIIANESYGALFKGWAPRVSRIAPQFGIVLVSFDYLQNHFSD